MATVVEAAGSPPPMDPLRTASVVVVVDSRVEDAAVGLGSVAAGVETLKFDTTIDEEVPFRVPARPVMVDIMMTCVVEFVEFDGEKLADVVAPAVANAVVALNVGV